MKKMRKESTKKKSTTLRDILDSDDELPTEYIDSPFVPAYQMDNRFEHIEYILDEKVNEEINEQKNEPEFQHDLRDELSNGRTVIARGYLSKKDTFCLQCLEPNASQKTLIWFFNFLILKDLHAPYTFLRTCLVPSYYSSDYSKPNEKMCKFKL